MRLEKSTYDDYTTLKPLSEKISSNRSADLKSEFVVLNAEGTRNLIVNLEKVEHVDSSGLSAMLTANRLCKGVGGILVLCCLNSHVESLVKVSKLDSVFTILGTEEEARERVFMHMLESDITDEESEDEDTSEDHASDTGERVSA